MRGRQVVSWGMKCRWECGSVGWAYEKAPVAVDGDEAEGAGATTEVS